MIGKLALGAALVLLAAGCATPPPTAQEEAMYTALRAAQNDPTLRAQFVQECANHVATTDPAEIQSMALVMRIDVAAVPRTFCRRALAGVADGRLTLPDLVAFQRGRADTDTLNRFLPVILDESADAL